MIDRFSFFQAADRLRCLVRSRGLGDVYKAQPQLLLFFAVAVYRLQAREGRHFLHEHPAGATSWAHPASAKLRVQPGVDAVVAHMGAVGPVADTHLTLPTSCPVESSVRVGPVTREGRGAFDAM